MLYITEPRACERCKQEFLSLGMPTNVVSSWILVLCPLCTKGLLEVARDYMHPSFSENIKSEQDFHAHGVDVTEQEEKAMTCARKEVFDIMKDGNWRTVDQILCQMVRLSTPQSVTIYLRSFREKRYGEYIVDRRKRAGTRIFEYRLLPPS